MWTLGNGRIGELEKLRNYRFKRYLSHGWKARFDYG